MAEHVLVAYDDTKQAREALEYCLQEHASATVTVLHVINPSEVTFSASAALPDYPEEWFREEKAESNRILEDAAARGNERGRELDTVVEVGSPASTIVEYADDHDVDHIVLGSHGRKGVSRIFLGSVAEAVMRRSSVPVTVVR